MKGLIEGIKKHPWQGLVACFAAFSVMFTLAKALTFFIPGVELKGTNNLLTIILISVVYAVVKVWQPSKISFPINHTNTTIEIKFGDLFREDGFRAIAVSEFFDSEIGVPVSARSLHGIFLKKCFGGHPQTFDAVINQQLQNIEAQTVNKQIGKSSKYPIGTTAVVPVNSDHYLCFAFCAADPSTAKVYADVPMLWQALNGLWQHARISLGGAPLCVPLVGSGLSGVGLPARRLLDLIILSIITESKRQQITTNIKVILTDDKFSEIDLNAVKQYWS